MKKVFDDILLLFAIVIGTAWISFQRRKYRRRSRALLPQERKALKEYFDADTLGAVRIAFAPQLVSPLISTLAKLFRIHLAQFSSTMGITFGEVVLIIRDDKTAPVNSSLLFHEIIHVVQYRVLGLRGFMGRYIRGWNENSREYLLIPLERDAYSLQSRFDKAEIFDAEETAKERLKA